ncbi:3-oxoacyl-[acyl-carrier-protein] synthase III C-terminal domain-containing protein [Streptomyces odontomachi]|uniref:3-oxoacyl-[acyl-carrier-protein] synthase III C-terminal domain-containing protein n=1 Tax=Streptomyces odontomachi TaxID=2944940 RepID=UPI0021090645|nr:3-oxoacyl-[acyl-carrier-protein] synthase III C-terminal domain-containing protein [Streptomyces sp. ODS25]
MDPIFVQSISYTLGENKYELGESGAAGRLATPVDDLADAGFRWHHVCAPETSAYDLARAAVAPLAEAGSLHGVSAIVYATCLPCNANLEDDGAWRETRDAQYLVRSPASRLQAEFALSDAVVIGLTQQACTGMLGAIRVGRALLQTEPGWDKVLCVTADRLPDGTLYELTSNLVSDGAAACLLSWEPTGFRHVAGHHISDGALGGSTEPGAAMGSYYEYVIRLVTETLASAGMGMADVDVIVPQNVNPHLWDILARALDCPPDRIAMPSLPDVGHVLAADNLINVKLLRESGRVRAGDRVLLLMAGLGMNWQSTVLEAV